MSDILNTMSDFSAIEDRIIMIHPDQYKDLMGSYGGSSGYVMQTRQLGKSQLMSAMYGSSTSHKGWTARQMTKIARKLNKNELIHVFQHAKGYSEVRGTSAIPDHCYYLFVKRWYQRGKGKHTVKAIPVTKVPSEHRLMLRMLHIEQPE